MTKRQLIDEIMEINQGAEPAFLAQFEDMELTEYLDHLVDVREPRECEPLGVYVPVEAPRTKLAPDQPPFILDANGGEVVVGEPEFVGQATFA
jgi:hypothetical protein